jgi:hypothetical protein
MRSSMLNPKAHQTAPVRVVGTVGLDELGPAPAPGGSVAESRPSPVGGGPATWLTLEFIAPDAPRPQRPTNWPATQRRGGGRREHDPPATRRVTKGERSQAPPAWLGRLD